MFIKSCTFNSSLTNRLLMNLTPKYDNYFWDLDGTISNSKEGIYNSILYSLDKLSIEKPSEDILRSFIGPPLYVSYMKHWYPESKEKAQHAVSLYREYYQEKGVYENSVFSGIKELISALKEAGSKMFVTTAKPTHYAKIVIEHSGMSDLFEAVYGSEMGGSRANKTELIQAVYDDYPTIKNEKNIIIGDRYYDLQGGNSHGIDTAGVLFGYGTLEELQSEKPTYICANTDELTSNLIQ